MKKNNGFTLIEILVSLGIISFLSIFIAQSFFTTIKTNIKAEILKEVKQNGDYALNIISRMVQNAQAITDCSADKLTIINPNGESSTFELKGSASPYQIASNSSALTSDKVSVSNFNISCQQIAARDTQVKIGFTLEQAGEVHTNYEKASLNFETTVSMRNITY
jgi:prepilin-type N-terminal cleavage/methylation domain-containing protein